MDILALLTGRRTPPAQGIEPTIDAEFYGKAKTAYKESKVIADSSEENSKILEAIKFLDLALRTATNQDARQKYATHWKKLYRTLPEHLQQEAVTYAEKARYNSLAAKELAPSPHLAQMLAKLHNPTTAAEDFEATIVSDWHTTPPQSLPQLTREQEAFEKLCEAVAGNNNNKTSELLEGFLIEAEHSANRIKTVLAQHLATLSPGINPETLIPCTQAINPSGSIGQHLQTLLRISCLLHEKGSINFLPIAGQLALSVITIAGTAGCANQKDFVDVACPVLAELDNTTPQLHNLPRYMHSWARGFYAETKNVVQAASLGGLLETRFATHNHLPEMEIISLDDAAFKQLFGQADGAHQAAPSKGLPDRGALPKPHPRPFSV